MPDQPIETLLDRALQARADFFAESEETQHATAFRLFNGFLEGEPGLVADLYARTLVLTNFADPPEAGRRVLDAARLQLLVRLPWIRSVLVKTRSAAEEQERRGVLAVGQPPDRRVLENGVWYAVDLALNLDASLYLDTRFLRAWAKEHLANRLVLNTFAYTGSLGVAAMAGGARRVVQMDRNRRFLNLAKDSYSLNGFPVQKDDFLTGDFWIQVGALKRSGALFDCVFVDPPFFSVTDAGRVDLVTQNHRVINKIRPLIGHHGYLVVINNALFVSGTEYIDMLERLCSDGYLSIEELIPVPPDFTGLPETRAGSFPADPSPFNHSTKIAVLRARRKDERQA